MFPEELRKEHDVDVLCKSQGKEIRPVVRTGSCSFYVRCIHDNSQHPLSGVRALEGHSPPQTTPAGMYGSISPLLSRLWQKKTELRHKNPKKTPTGQRSVVPPPPPPSTCPTTWVLFNYLWQNAAQVSVLMQQHTPRSCEPQKARDTWEVQDKKWEDGPANNDRRQEKRRDGTRSQPRKSAIWQRLRPTFGKVETV